MAQESQESELIEVTTMAVPPKVAALISVADIRNKISCLGPRPDASAVQDAKRCLLSVDADLAQKLDSVFFSEPPSGVDAAQWSASQSEKEKELKDAAEREKEPIKAVLQLHELHILYEDMLKNAENLLEGMPELEASQGENVDPVNLQAATAIDVAIQEQQTELNLSSQQLQFVPETIGKIISLQNLNISSNLVKLVPDAIGNLVNLVVLDLHSNHLKSLPDSLGLLICLRILDISSNQLQTLPESIMGCSGLVELNADFNKIEYLPTNFGLGLTSLRKLSLHLNNLTYLPASICEATSLQYLDVHFNKLRMLPNDIGRLINLEVLNASSNFSDFTYVPDSIGDLSSLTCLDLSYNQMKYLPVSIGRLQNLKSLKLDETPVLDPPLEVVHEGHAALMAYLAERWKASLSCEEPKSETVNSPKVSIPFVPPAVQDGVGGWISGAYGSISGYLGNVAGKWLGPQQNHVDDYLEQQL